MFFVASMFLILFAAISSRCFYRIFVRFVNITFTKKCFLSVLISLLIAFLCLYVGNMALALFIQLIICFIFTDILFVFSFLPFVKKRDITKKKNFKIGYSMFVVLLAIILTLWGYFNYFDMRTTSYDVSFNGKKYLPTKVLFISDTHLGDRNSDKILSDITDKINNEKPEIIILGGDIFDTESNKDDLNNFCTVMGNYSKNIPMLYVYGNHDTSYGAPLTRNDIESKFDEYNIKVLCDSSVEFNGIRFIGRDDYSASKNSGGRAELKTLLPNDEDKPVFVIDHQPIGISKMKSLGVDVSISGHTHNGQIFPVGILSEVFKLNELEYGLYNDGNYVGIVSSGAAGWGMNMRTEGHGEVVTVNIK